MLQNKQARPHLLCYNWALTVYWEVQGFASKTNFLSTKEIQLKQTSALPKAHSWPGLGQGRSHGRAALVRQKHTTETAETGRSGRNFPPRALKSCQPQGDSPWSHFCTVLAMMLSGLLLLNLPQVSPDHCYVECKCTPSVLQFPLQLQCFHAAWRSRSPNRGQTSSSCPSSLCRHTQGPSSAAQTFLEDLGIQKNSTAIMG